MLIQIFRLSTYPVEYEAENNCQVDNYSYPVDNENSHIHIVFSRFLTFLCGIFLNLSTSFPHFVDNVMLICGTVDWKIHS